MTPDTARKFWKALMDNASRLSSDAHVLLSRGSYGRARSLTVLAQEELGKALWLYQTFQDAWSDGSAHEQDVEKLSAHGRSHATKYQEAFVFSDELETFWGEYDFEDMPVGGSQAEWDTYFAGREAKAVAAGKQANELKMQGFYVDLDPVTGTVLDPSAIQAGTIAADLETAAQVIEMLLIKDHSRMKLYATTPYDSTHSAQHRLLPISHPEDWAGASEEFRNSEPGKDGYTTS